MNKRACISFLSFAVAIVFSAGLLAQEKTEVTVQLKKDGKVIQDTTYQFNDADQAGHVMKMLGVMLGNEMSTDEPSGKMVFISEDGKTTRVKEIEGDSLVWISEGEPGDEDVKVIKVIVTGDEDGEWKVIKSNDDEDEDVEVQVKVIKKVEKEEK